MITGAGIWWDPMTDMGKLIENIALRFWGVPQQSQLLEPQQPQEPRSATVSAEKYKRNNNKNLLKNRKTLPSRLTEGFTGGACNWDQDEAQSEWRSQRSSFT